MLLSLISAHFDHGDESAAIAKLHSFEVATKTPFADYFRVLRLLIASVTESERVLAPNVEVVLEVARNSVSEQYPGLIPILYPGELATASTPFASIDEMWLVFGGRSTNKTPAINGNKHFALSPPGGLLLLSYASGCTQSQSAAPKPFKGSSGSFRNAIVMNVAPSALSPDPFVSSAAEWPANWKLSGQQGSLSQLSWYGSLI